jgi:hypothetical protein
MNWIVLLRIEFDPEFDQLLEVMQDALIEAAGGKLECVWSSRV